MYVSNAKRKMIIKVHIEVRYIHYEMKYLNQGSFPVQSLEYEINPDQAAALSAIHFIKEIQRLKPTMELTNV